GRFLGWPATIFIVTQVLAGIPLLPYALLHWHSDNSLRFASFLAVALGASLFKVQLPGIHATMSANFLFILVGILDLSYSETLLMVVSEGLSRRCGTPIRVPARSNGCLTWQIWPSPLALQNWFFIAKPLLASGFAGQ